MLLSVNLREWQHRDIVVKIGDQQWIYEWSLLMYEEGDSAQLYEECDKLLGAVPVSNELGRARRDFMAGGERRKGQRCKRKSAICWGLSRKCGWRSLAHGVERYLAIDDLSSRPAVHTTLWLKVSLVRIHSICMSSMMSHVWACVVCSRFVFFLSLSFLYFLSHCLPVLCPAHQLPCGRNRRGIKPLLSRTKRSSALWRYTTISQVVSPTSSTTPTTQRFVQWSSRMNSLT